MAFTTQSVFNSVMGALGINDDINKGGPHNTNEEQTVRPEYESSLSDEDILGVIRYWTDDYDNYIKQIESWQKDNERYWLGNQYNPIEQAGTTKRALVDNVIFEALETFLPLATQTNPDPVVASDSSPQGQALADDVKNALVYQADRQKLRMLLKSMTRNWAIYFIGCLKVYWNPTKNDMDTEVVSPKRLILDPNAWIDEGGKYHGEYIGEYKKTTVKKLKEMFPEKATLIEEKGGSQEGTRLTYIEWTTRTDLFWTLGNDVVLDKTKNINWNYDGEIEIHNPEDEDNPHIRYIKGKNHFIEPEFNYIFLSVFNLGKQPHDETGLLYQSIPMQDQINERLLQMNKNTRLMNNGVALNGLYFTKEQASQALTQLERGGGLWVPNNEKMQGRLEEAFKFTNPSPLPADVRESYESARARLAGIMGTSGVTPTGIAKQDDVRGKIMAQQADTSRIGGGITTYIEQVADTWYNWQVQLMFVHYDEPHYIAAIGENGAQEITTIHNSQFVVPLMITVKEGSLIPKDPMTKRNEAVDLWSANAIDPISLYKALEFPDPYNQAKQLLLWQLIQKGAVPPNMMFPDFQAPPVNLPGTQPGTGGPAVNAAPADGEIAPPSQVGDIGPVAEASRQIIQQVPI